MMKTKLWLETANQLLRYFLFDYCNKQLSLPLHAIHRSSSIATWTGKCANYGKLLCEEIVYSLSTQHVRLGQRRVCVCVGHTWSSVQVHCLGNFNATLETKRVFKSKIWFIMLKRSLNKLRYNGLIKNE